MTGSVRVRELIVVAALAAAVLLPGLSSYTLVDPWEGHYAEVGRRMLADHDWVHLHWKSESFRSKPALTPWLIAASLRAHGLARDGGYSGEMVSTSRVVWAVRLPFALCAIGAVLALWWMLRRLVSRRAAWLGAMCLLTTPFFCLVARQAITDMPMVAATTSALALLLLAAHDGARPLRRLWWRLTAYHLSLTGFALIVGAQVAYTAHYVATHRLGPGMRVAHPGTAMVLSFGLGFAALILLTSVVWRVRTMRGVYLLWAYALLGVSVLAKGPPGAVMTFAVTALYIIATRQWRLIWRLRLLEGTLLAVLVAAPWHVAMALVDGTPWITRYIGYHWLERAGSGAHMINRPGEGTFVYYVDQLGIGLWPLLVALPAALGAALRRHADTVADHVRLLALLWAVTGLAMFSLVETKFHHYILPAVPGFALLVALWLDDVIARRERVAVSSIGLGIALTVLVALDVCGQQERIVEMFVYRYDRPWPSSAPWHVDLSWELAGFAAAFVIAGASLCVRRLRHWPALGLLAVATLFSYYVMNRYMGAAGPHWGQGQLHRRYYAMRRIHGVEYHYGSAAELRRAWPGTARTVSVDTVIPDTLRLGAPMRVVVSISGQHATLAGTLARIEDHRLYIDVPASETARLGPLLDAPMTAPSAPSFTQVDADRLITWNLFWRAEIFWSGGELWGPSPDTRSSFGYNNDAGLLAYLRRPEARGRTFFLITAAGQLNHLRSLLPSRRAKESLGVLDHSSNKFTLVRFEL